MVHYLIITLKVVAVLGVLVMLWIAICDAWLADMEWQRQKKQAQDEFKRDKLNQ